MIDFFFNLFIPSFLLENFGQSIFNGCCFAVVFVEGYTTQDKKYNTHHLDKWSECRVKQF